jgi:hypothetical protein
MHEVWLRSNSRPALVVIIPSFLMGIAGLALLAWYWQFDDARYMRWIGYALTVFGLGLAAWQTWLASFPRMAYEEGQLLLYLPPPEPLRVPIDIVECFFIGQGPSLLPDEKGGEAQAANIIVRLAQKATDWHTAETPPLLAKWADGYITLRGALCESFDGDFVNALNKKLAEIHRARRAVEKAGSI